MSEIEPIPALPYEHPEVQRLLIANTKAALVGGLAVRYSDVLQVAMSRCNAIEKQTEGKVSFSAVIDVINFGDRAEAPFAVHKSLSVFEGQELERMHLSKVNQRGIIISGSYQRVGILDHQTQEVIEVEEGFTEEDLEQVREMYSTQAKLPWQPMYDNDTSGLLVMPHASR